MPVFGTATPPTGTSGAFSRGEGGFWLVFGTATMPTGAPEPSPRGEGGLLAGLRHGSPAHRYFSGIPAWRRGSSDRSSARQPCPQVPQCHSGVAKGASDRSSARHPCPQVLQSHPRVAKRRKSVPLTGLRSGLRPGLTRRPYQQVPQWHPRGATVSWLSDSSQIGLREIHLARAVIDYQVVSN